MPSQTVYDMLSSLDTNCSSSSSALTQMIVLLMLILVPCLSARLAILLTKGITTLTSITDSVDPKKCDSRVMRIAAFTSAWLTAIVLVFSAAALTAICSAGVPPQDLTTTSPQGIGAPPATRPPRSSTSSDGAAAVAEAAAFTLRGPAAQAEVLSPATHSTSSFRFPIEPDSVAVREHVHRIMSGAPSIQLPLALLEDILTKSEVLSAQRGTVTSAEAQSEGASAAVLAASPKQPPPSEGFPFGDVVGPGPEHTSDSHVAITANRRELWHGTNPACPTGFYQVSGDCRGAGTINGIGGWTDNRAFASCGAFCTSFANCDSFEYCHTGAPDSSPWCTDQVNCLAPPGAALRCLASPTLPSCCA